MRRISCNLVCFSIVLFFCLFGCGGGSDDGGGGAGGAGGVGYTGVTSQAVISESNAQSITGDTVDVLFTGEAGGIPGITGAVVSGSTEKNLSILWEKDFFIRLYNKKKTSTSDDFITGASYQEEGECGGTVTISESNPPTGPGNFPMSGSETYSNYCECLDYSCDTTVVVNGTISGSGNGVSQWDDDWEEYDFVSGHVTMNLNANAKMYEDSSLILDITVNGPMERTWSSEAWDNSEETIIFNYVRINNLTGKTTQFKNFKVYAATGYGGADLTMNGRIYLHDHGYVDITTVNDLQVGYSGKPNDGDLILSGSNGTKLFISFTSSGYFVEADFNGDGVYEYSSDIYYW